MFFGQQPINMKTFLSLFSTLVLILALASLDRQRLDPDVLFSALAVAAVSAFALTEGRGANRSLGSTRPTRICPPAAYAGAAR